MSCRYLAVLVCLLLVGCGPQVAEFGGPTMGSHYTLKYVAGEHTPAQAEVQAQVERVLAEVDQQFSTWRADSDLSRFNALPAGSCAAMPAPVRELVIFANTLWEDSDGAFDITVEPLMNLWGFGPQSRGQQVPSAEQIVAAKGLVGQAYLRIDGEQLCKDIALQLDLNSIVAGYTVDRIAALLGTLGIDSYLLDVTGELKAAGHKPDGTPWKIAIEAPRDDVQVAEQVLALDGWGVSTSGDYHNYFERNGQRYSHTLDPRTGAPISHQLAEVTVLDRSTLRADGLSTLLMVLGPERGFAFAEERGIAALFVSRTASGFSSRATAAFSRQFAKAHTPLAGTRDVVHSTLAYVATNR
ncbi:FAD:protein FMN transferase [Pseudomonas sp. GV071]|uniref:FAD:protein FMN transferase n=1 Tax=Pseudomonas sp. GV071 TaxID=2135754 RepID=UPI000D4D3CE6|nr:FAD:protein FMN transferase [Pseudomonas sp. GV071]PTQ69946.1 thiamine biosynthesis lipoprotein [Pseudomonas sp. GV071]